jgi:hypothetical protein
LLLQISDCLLSFGFASRRHVHFGILVEEGLMELIGVSHFC